ncbi:MAG: tryptophan-rich sensory protein [Anaerolineae bacterium]|nr:tryptophan-rich sensory protein [Anaerolineae bacterium]
MKKLTLHQVVNLVITIAVIVVNVLANALPLNGKNTGEISDRFDIYFVPAGYVFSIWGVIYLGLIAFAIYQILPAQRDNPSLKRMTPFYTLGNLANIAWIFLWHYEAFAFTLIAMLVLLGSLIAIYIVLGIGRNTVSPGMRWTVHLPFSIYLGWVSVATVANISQVLTYFNWSGWGIVPEVWTLLMLLVAAILAVLAYLIRRDVAYGLVFVWAYIGIAVKHIATPSVFAPAAVLVGVLGLMLSVGEIGAFLLPQKTK